MRVMPRGLGGARWCRLLLIVLLVLPVSAPLGVYADDGWIGISDPDQSDESRLRLFATVPSDSTWVPPAPMAVRRAGRPVPGELVIAGWTCLTPTDRAPPRV
jgi:hypothetical protein